MGLHRWLMWTFSFLPPLSRRAKQAQTHGLDVVMRGDWDLLSEKSGVARSAMQHPQLLGCARVGGPTQRSLTTRHFTLKCSEFMLTALSIQIQFICLMDEHIFCDTATPGLVSVMAEVL